MTHSIDSPSDARVKIWRRLLTTSAPLQLQSIRIIESSVFHPQVIEFPRALAIVGAHGLGKTVFLRMVEAAFGYTEPIDLPPFFPGWLNHTFPVEHVEGRIEVTIGTPAGELCQEVNLSDSSEDRRQAWLALGECLDAWYVSPVTAMSEISSVFNSGGKDPIKKWRNLSKVELDALRSILGWAYDRVVVNEVPLFSAEPGESEWAIPFVSARRNSVEIDTTMMSQGELWVHYLHWFLERQAGRQSLTLIDEPETFLAVRSQRPLMDLVARSVLSNEHQVIVSTHSPEVMSRFPLENIRLCVREDGKVRVISPSSFSQVRDAIGVEPTVKAVALVEDEFAAKMLEVILSQFDYTILREVEILPVSGASEVVSGIRVFSKLRRLYCFGVLDGDQRLLGRETSSIAQLPIRYLPGDGSPEAELLKAAAGSIAHVARAMGRSNDEVSAALSSVDRLDHQYQISQFAEQMGYPLPVAVHILSRVWLRNSSVSKAARALVDDIRSNL